MLTDEDFSKIVEIVGQTIEPLYNEFKFFREDFYEFKTYTVNSFNRLNKRMDHLGERVDTVDKNLKLLDKRTGAVEKAIQKLQKRT